MRKQKKISLAALMAALGVVMMYLGSLLQVLDLTAVALAALLVVLARIELGSPYDWLVYGVTGVLSLMLMGGFNLFAPAFYLLYGGMYPILKAYFEKLPKALIITAKTVYFLVVCFVMVAGAYLFTTWLTGADFFTEGFSAYTYPLLFALYVLAVFVSFVYDMLLTQLIVIYMRRVRPKIASVFR